MHVPTNMGAVQLFYFKIRRNLSIYRKIDIKSRMLSIELVEQYISLQATSIHAQVRTKPMYPMYVT
jgi:hypothetical protein